MDRKVDVAVIGAGTAGLSALKEIRRKTSDFLLVDRGPLGTTCARVGCMPSKALLQTAHDFHRRRRFAERGIRGAEGLSVDSARVMDHVRHLRDHFVSFVLRSIERYGERFLPGEARFLEPTVVRVGKTVIRARSVILATGSRPVVPHPWRALGDNVLTTDTFFDLPTLPQRMAVVGLGVVGTELGQALARLGVEVIGVGRDPHIAGLQDPEVAAAAAEILSGEFSLRLGKDAEVSRTGETLAVRVGAESFRVDAVLASLGRQPNVEGLGLEEAGVPVGPNGMPPFHPETLQVGEHRLFIAGDVDGVRPVLHEAADDGIIAGYNSVRETPECFRRRVPLGITFCEPNAVFVGRRFMDLMPGTFQTGSADFSSQGRATIKGENAGRLHVYGDPGTGRLLGAEMVAPGGEHLGHLLAWGIQQGQSVREILGLPFYHPALEEALRTALKALWRKLDSQGDTPELAFCRSESPSGLG